MFTDHCVPRFCCLQYKLMRVVSYHYWQCKCFALSINTHQIFCGTWPAILPFSTVIVYSVNPTLNLRQIDSKCYTQTERNLTVCVHCSLSQTQPWPTPHLTFASSSTLAPACSSSSATWQWPSWQATWSGVHPPCGRMNNKQSTCSVTQSFNTLPLIC